MKDKNGNKLEVGDLVLLEFGGANIEARVIEMSSGGIVSGLKKGGQEITPSQVILRCDFTLNLHPQDPVVPSVRKMADHAPEEAERIRKDMGGSGMLELPN